MEYVSDLSSCFTTQPLYAFPQILGGQNDHTMFTCMCYDEVNQNLIVAGQSRSQDVIDSGKTPIIIKIDEITGGVVWHKQVDSSQSAVGTELIQECTISEGQQTYYIGVSASPNFAMILLNYLTGDVVQVYYNNPSANTLQKNDNIIGLKMDQNDMIYMATAEGNTFSITAFQHNILQSIIVPVYYKEFGSNSDKFKAITAQFNTNLNRMYIAGDNQKLPFLISYPISKLGIHQLNSDLQQISCVDGVGVSGQDINFILTQELSGGLQIDIVKSWSFTYSSASSMACLAVTHNTTYLNFLYTTTATESVVNYGYVKISDYTSPLIVIRIQTSVTQISNTLQPKNGFINSQGSKIFDIGSTTAINMQTYPKQVGYVNRYPINSLETCLQYSPQSFQISMTIQTSYSSGYINTLITTLPTSTAQNNKFKIFSSGSYTVGDPVEMSTIPLLMIDKMNLPSPQCVDIPQGIISVPTFNPIYYIIEDSNTVIKNGFSYSRSCSETLTWTYSALLTNGSTLPSFIQFTGVHPQLGFSISTFDQNYAGSIFNIEISGNLNSIKYATTYLDVYVFSNIVPINESPYFIEKVSDSIQITAQKFDFKQNKLQWAAYSKFGGRNIYKQQDQVLEVFSKVYTLNQIKTLKVPQMDDNNQGIEIVTSVINDLVMSSVFGGIGASLILGQFIAIFNVVTFDPIDITVIWQRMLGLQNVDKYEPYNDRFDFTGIKYDMRNKKANEHLGELVKVLRDRSEAGGLYYGIYYLRRVFFIASVFLLEDYLTVQIQLFILSNIFYIIYLIYFRPITVSYNQEVFNELSTLTISYIMLVFTDFLYDNDMKLLMSHVFIIAYSLNICINLIWVILEAILIIRKQFKVKVKHIV
eukprot:403367431